MIMALVTMKKLLQQAKNEGRGVGAFSVGNMEMVKGAIQAAPTLRMQKYSAKKQESMRLR